MSAPQRSTGRRSAPRRTIAATGATPPSPTRLTVSSRVSSSLAVPPSVTFTGGGPEAADPYPAEAADPHPVEIAGLLHELTSRLLGADDMAHALDRLADFGARAVPDTLRCSVALIGEGGPPSLATSGPQAQAVDDAQYASGNGPALEAARTRAVVTATDLSTDVRWPHLAECATTDGVRGVASIPLDVQRSAVGSVSFFTERPGGMDPEHLLTAMALVNQAEVLLGEIQRRESLHEGAIVDRAAGVIIAQRGCGVHEAYDVLRDTSQRLGLPREAVAERLIAAAARNAES
ncbi:GAF and ANTAR domain-containing protein [Symbioplanes lichenis]|uniref:GAF and ANTAR domain-containing protein n=1 Tax=Symbioplanes lichenis TaxID=1629072 RepID=UPI0027397D35|nr:GAF and ANTAR domain-containing protein [Actinoplanes lichenis]